MRDHGKERLDASDRLRGTIQDSDAIDARRVEDYGKLHTWVKKAWGRRAS